MSDSLEYYKSQSQITDPVKYAYLLENLPTDIKELCNIVHGIVAHHDDTKENYGFTLPQGRIMEANLRYQEKILETIVKMDSSPLKIERKPINRLLGSCRDFALVLCSILRFQGTPARVRCGFAAYFVQGRYADHWVCEYFDKDQKKWLLADAELGEMEKKNNNIKFDHTNIPRDQFIVAGDAWKLCRQVGLDANLFGVPNIGIKGYWFIRADVLRDLTSLNKVELLPWDYTNFFDKQFDNLSELKDDEIKLIDEISDLTSNPNFDIEKVKELYNSNPDLQVKATIKSYLTSDPIEVSL